MVVIRASWRALLALALAACSLPPADAWVNAVLAASGLAAPTVMGDCPWLAAAGKCACRWSYGILHSSSLYGTFVGPRMTLDDDKTYFHWGEYCNTVTSKGRNIYPGGSGGVQVGNGDWTFKTGVEVDVYYQVQDDAGKAVRDCWVKMYLDNPYAGSNDFRVSLDGNGCPPNLMTEMGDVAPGDMESGRDFYVYLDGVKPDKSTSASIGDLGLAAAPAVDAALARAEETAAAVAAAPVSAASAAAVLSAAAAALGVVGAALL